MFTKTRESALMEGYIVGFFTAILYLINHHTIPVEGRLIVAFITLALLVGAVIVSVINIDIISTKLGLFSVAMISVFSVAPILTVLPIVMEGY